MLPLADIDRKVAPSISSRAHSSRWQGRALPLAQALRHTLSSSERLRPKTDAGTAWTVWRYRYGVCKYVSTMHFNTVEQEQQLHKRRHAADATTRTQARIMLNYMMLLHKRKHTQQHTACRHYMNAGMQHGALHGTAPCRQACSRQAGRQSVGYSRYPQLSQAQITEQLCLSTSGGQVTSQGFHLSFAGGHLLKVQWFPFSLHSPSNPIPPSLMM